MSARRLEVGTYVGYAGRADVHGIPDVGPTLIATFPLLGRVPKQILPDDWKPIDAESIR